MPPIEINDSIPLLASTFIVIQVVVTHSIATQYLFKDFRLLLQTGETPRGYHSLQPQLEKKTS